MPNSIKESASGLALQVTKPARSAGLVKETSDGDVTYRAEVWVYGFDNLLLVVDADEVATHYRAGLVSAACCDTDSVYGGARTTLSDAGHGYQVQLPVATDAGFELGDTAPAHPAPGVLLIHDGTQTRLVEDLATVRDEQVSR